jgi:BirA family biotin operon repressor/biotin-[acetyl-CoA-carboxylase] ligase
MSAVLGAPDPLSAEELRALFASRAGECGLCADGASFTVFDELDSTNSHARRLLAAAGALRDADGRLTRAGRRLHRSFYIAGTQTAGRGRMGRAFVSPPDCGLYFTLVFCPENAAVNPARYTTGAAVAAARTLERLFGIDCGVKWVNDIFFAGRKIGGILTEGDANPKTGRIEALVTGVGVNVREPQGGFPPELRAVAGAVTTAFPPACASRNRIAAELAVRLLSVYEREDPAAVLAEYKRRSIILGKTIEVRPVAAAEDAAAAPYRACALDIDGEARLVVRTETGRLRRLSAGEVRLNSESLTR